MQVIPLVEQLLLPHISKIWEKNSVHASWHFLGANWYILKIKSITQSRCCSPDTHTVKQSQSGQSKCIVFEWWGNSISLFRAMTSSCDSPTRLFERSDQEKIQLDSTLFFNLQSTLSWSPLFLAFRFLQNWRLQLCFGGKFKRYSGLTSIMTKWALYLKSH